MMVRKRCSCAAPLTCPHDWQIVRPTWRARLRRGWRWLTRPPGEPGECPACGAPMTDPMPLEVLTLIGRDVRAVMTHCAACGWTRLG